MKDELLPYYERELFFIRQLATEFAQQHPERAGSLQLHPDVAADPHVERLIEAFALIAGRIQHKIEDEFPEITEALLGLLYPHYLRPIPAMSVAQIEMDPEQNQATSGHTIKRDATLFANVNGGGSCYFRSCYPLTLWPIEVSSAAFVLSSAAGLGLVAGDSRYAVKINLRCLGGLKFAALTTNTLRFFLGGEPQTSFLLYELLFNDVQSVLARQSFEGAKIFGLPVTLASDCIAEVGFGRNEGMLPYSERSFLGFRLLQEYFSFPQKFLFFDLKNLEQAFRSCSGDQLEIYILLREFDREDAVPLLQQAVSARSFMLGCTPVVNLFERCAEPIRLTQAKTEYRVTPDFHHDRSMEVYSIDRVVATSPNLERPQEYEPFYSMRHTYGVKAGESFWHAARRSSAIKGDGGTDVYLTLLDLHFRANVPPMETVTAFVTCTNREQVDQVKWTRAFGELQIEESALCRARFVLKPTTSLRADARRGLQWRLISHLSLNHLSIIEGGVEAFQELLRLYNFSESPALNAQIRGVLRISSQPEVSRVPSENGLAFARGLHTTVELDEHQFDGGSIFLFGSVLERFLALYTSINSFSKLSVVSQQRKGIAKVWPARAGEQILL